MPSVKIEDVHPTWSSFIAIRPDLKVYSAIQAPNTPKANPPEDYAMIDVYAGRISHLLSNLDSGYSLSLDMSSYIPFMWDGKRRLMAYRERPVDITSYVSILSSVTNDGVALHAVDKWSARIETHAFLGITATPVIVLTITATVGRGEILSFAYHLTVTSPLAYPAPLPPPGPAQLLPMGRDMTPASKVYITPNPSEAPP